jgi:methionyl-tRNA formyltransferase
MKSTTIVFMGSPDFAVPSLRRLAEYFSVVGVVTQPDRPAGRGRKTSAPPVKHVAADLEIPVIQPRRLSRDQDAMRKLQAWDPDLIVVAAFGQILKPDVLELPMHGCLNVHGSLLPRWRGAAPLNAAILHGDRETGVTIMKMDAGLDTGPILNQQAMPIRDDDTAGSLFHKMAKLGAELLINTIPAYLQGEMMPKPQDDALATYAPMLTKADGELDFNQTAAYLSRQVRAYQPWPGTFFAWQGSRIKVHTAHAIQKPSPGNGKLIIVDGYPAVGTMDGILVLDQVQPAGKKSMPGDVFLHGVKQW